MDNHELEIKMYKNRIEDLEEELNQYKSIYGELNNPKTTSFSDKDERIEQAKEVAKKGLDFSKELFSAARNTFGKTKDIFLEEREKQKQFKSSDDSKNFDNGEEDKK